ncbi:MAG: carbohydrate-binding module family 20 domain-containing protein [bacterium]
MILISKKFWLMVALLIALSCGTRKSSSVETITFRVIPKALPSSSKIYITGNHSKLGNWQPNVAALHQQSDGSWSRSFSFRHGTLLEFKITRGNWESEAVNVDGIEFPNYVLEVVQNTTLVIEIGHWRDTFKRATFLSAQRLSNKGGNLELLENWKYRAGDNPEWANPAYNDSAWEEVDPCLPPKQLPKSGWDSIGWFRLHLTVDSTLWNIPLAMYIIQTGTSEVYLNGQLLYQYGKVGSDKEAETAFQDPNPKHIMFGEQGHHVLAVRYSNHATRWYNRLGMGAGFECQLGELNSYIADRANRVRQSTVYQMVFTTAFAAFAFAHFLLFMFSKNAVKSSKACISAICTWR